MMVFALRSGQQEGKIFQAGATVKELSDNLKRTREAIRSRLKKLGLTAE